MFQMHYLEMQDSAVVIQDGLVKFLPLHGDEEDVTRTKPILTEIYRRVWTRRELISIAWM